MSAFVCHRSPNLPGRIVSNLEGSTRQWGARGIADHTAHDADSEGLFQLDNGGFRVSDAETFVGTGIETVLRAQRFRMASQEEDEDEQESAAHERDSNTR